MPGRNARRLKSTALLPVLVGAGCAALFFTTAADAIQVADSGEVAAVACGGGAAHPPGYPLYSLLGGLFCSLPGGSPAARLGWLSVVSGIGACLALYFICLSVGGRREGAVGGALTLATAWLFWRYAGIVEVFALHVALSLSLVLVALRTAACDDQRRHLRWALMTGLVGGLALSNHHSAVWMAPLCAVAVLYPLRDARAAFVRAVVSLGGVLLGLLPYLTLLSGDPDALPRWGELATFSDLVDHFLRRDYGTMELGLRDDLEGGSVVAAFLASVWDQLLIPLWLVAIAGWLLVCAHAAGVKGRLPEVRLPRPAAAALAVLPLLCGPVFFSLFNLGTEGVAAQVVERFFLLPLAFVALFAGVGLSAVFAFIQERRRPLGWGVLAVVLLGAAWTNYPRADVSDQYAVEDYAAHVLATAEPGALILGSGDVRLFSIVYAQEVLGIGQDVQYVDVWMLLYPWYVEQQRRRFPNFLYEHQPERVDSLGLIERTTRSGRPVYIANSYGQVATRWPSYPVGPLRRLATPGVPMPKPEEVIAINEGLLSKLERRGNPPDRDHDPWSASLLEPYAQAWLVVARLHDDLGRPERAAEAHARADEWAPWLVQR